MSSGGTGVGGVRDGGGAAGGELRRPRAPWLGLGLGLGSGLGSGLGLGSGPVVPPVHGHQVAEPLVGELVDDHLRHALPG